MPVSLSIATVVELGGEKYLPADFLALFATVQEKLTPPKKEPKAVSVADENGLIPPQEDDEPPQRDFAPCGVIADWLDEHEEPILASTFRLMAKHKCAPNSSNTLWSFNGNLPKFLGEIRYSYANTFLDAVCKMATALARVKEEMGL